MKRARAKAAVQLVLSDPSCEGGWQPIQTAKKDGRWVWGEWPEITDENGVVRAPRLIEPMRWGKAVGYVPHWQMRGNPTMGPAPTRWAPMAPPPL